MIIKIPVVRGKMCFVISFIFPFSKLHCQMLDFFFFFYFRATPAAYGSSQGSVKSELQLLAYATATATWI